MTKTENIVHNSHVDIEDNELINSSRNKYMNGPRLGNNLKFHKYMVVSLGLGAHGLAMQAIVSLEPNP